MDKLKEKIIPLKYELMKYVEESNEESCEQLPQCSRKKEGQNKKKNGGSDKEVKIRGMKRKGIEDKGHRCLILDRFQVHIAL